ncbi:hypothetical protein [Alteromonas sp. KUL49]|uniref:glycosyltransferase family 9 protein n=1 Tax=Alteromonas sp. KUL49 TaxID=2480798 RepID=UPI00102F2765|nr:hypothetical protein [Alteromonas sp. KUL49]TAP39669.1 hypothetical protein EYS00_10075 [Alteromonas sp. KUL49]GEA11655.1 hypothetical protein KUL49_20300 [Alteromonas sp. KUL49]
MTDKILLIRMAEAGDVLSVGLPAVRYFKTKFPNADISVLTYGDCAGFFTIAEPSVSLITLPQDEWPENIINAIETFLGLAEKIIGQGFSRIVNLDTAFMPCFLARFFKRRG